MEKNLPTGFRSCCIWAACLYLFYGYIILLSGGGWAPIFLPIGSIIAAGRLYGLWTRLRRLKINAFGIRSRVPTIASDLVLLITVQHGFIQTQVEMERGNLVGAITCLALVTPVLSLVTRKTVLILGNRLNRN